MSQQFKQKSNISKDQMFATLHHEIKTPLTAIKGMVEQLADREELREDNIVRNLLVTTQYLSDFMKNMQEYTVLERGKMVLIEAAFEMDELLQYVQAIMEPLTIKKRISFTMEPSQVPYRYLYQDVTRLKQVLTNLLTNAVKATPYGGNITLSITSQPIEINRINMQFIITDSGNGMTPEFLEKAYEPFVQEQKQKWDEGVGLGLYITKQIVDRLEGKIQIYSELRKGTKVRVEFEVDAADEYYKKKEPEWSMEQKSSYDVERFKGKRVLVAEDDEMILEIFVNLLEKYGILADKTYDGEEALDIFEQSEEGYYKMILLDMVMPEKSGVEAAFAIRKLPRKDAITIPIIAVSGKAGIEDRQRALLSGMTNYVQKPFERKEVLEILKRYL